MPLATRIGFRSWDDVFDRWPRPSSAAVAADLGIKPGLVRSWRCRNSVPVRYWDAIVESAARWHIPGVTRADLHNLQRYIAAVRDLKDAGQPTTEEAAREAV